MNNNDLLEIVIKEAIEDRIDDDRSHGEEVTTGKCQQHLVLVRYVVFLKIFNLINLLGSCHTPEDLTLNGLKTSKRRL